MRRNALLLLVASGRLPRSLFLLAVWLGLVGISGCQARTEAVTGRSQELSTPVGGEMVEVPGGWFEMGSADAEETDQPQHKVHVSPFLIDKHPVTQEQYEQQMGTNPSHWKSPRNPVERVRWREAAAYCNARSRAEGLPPAYDPETWECDFESVGYRLPTEAEYEYVVRAGTTTEYVCGDTPKDLNRYAWYKANSPRGPQPVGQREPNPWGLYDMVGDVWEWCHDYYQKDYYLQSPDHDPHGPPRGDTRVIRGGGWNSRPSDCRSAYRSYEMPQFTDICFAKDVLGQIGFRCVRRPTKQASLHPISNRARAPVPNASPARSLRH